MPAQGSQTLSAAGIIPTHNRRDRRELFTIAGKVLDAAGHDGVALRYPLWKWQMQRTQTNKLSALAGRNPQRRSNEFFGKRDAVHGSKLGTLLRMVQSIAAFSHGQRLDAIVTMQIFATTIRANHRMEVDAVRAGADCQNRLAGRMLQ